MISNDVDNRKLPRRPSNLLTEDLIQAIPDIPDVPLVKVLGLVRRGADAGLKGSIDEVVEASGLLLRFQDGNVVLERVGHPAVLESDI